jgi:hypothetical protein
MKSHIKALVLTDSGATRKTCLLSRDRQSGGITSMLTVILVFLMSVSSSQVLAASDGQGYIEPGVGCMQDIAGFGLGCTANDVRVSGVADTNGDNIIDEGDITFAPVCDATAQNAGANCSADSTICLDADGLADANLCGDRCAFPGDTTTFSATFIFELSAQARYDVGAYFEVTPDTGGDGALKGTCDIITLPEDKSLFTRPDGSTGNFVDLDTTCKGGGCPQPGDKCGDIDNANNPVYYDMKGTKAVADTITALCVDTDNDGALNLPNCTSWRQSGANEICLDGGDAFPGSPSKCNCDPNFQVPINVPAATIGVVKTASPTSISEPSGSVQFSVSATNTSPFASLTIYSLMDDIYNDITTTGHDGITATTCTVPTNPVVLAHGETYSCSFVATVAGQGGDTETDTVTVLGLDENSNQVKGEDSATVTITDVKPSMTVSKSCSPCTRVEPGGSFTFTARVTNTSPADAITLASMVDDIYGDITQIAGTTCSVSQVIAIGGNYSCSFSVNELHQPPWSQTDTIQFVASDEESNELKQSDSAIITITDVPAGIQVVKTASPTSVNEPGGDVTYTYVISNLSTVDTLDVFSLVDDILGNLNGQGDCSLNQSLAPTGDSGDSYQCSVTAPVTGDSGDVITNEVEVMAYDDDDPKNTVTDKDTATVNVVNVAPTASLTKVPTQMAVTYVVTVTNDSLAESLTLNDLSDDQFGDLTETDSDVLETDCDVPKAIAIGDNYSCTFVGLVETSPHTNVATGTVNDNEGGTTSPSDSATVTFQSN